MESTMNRTVTAACATAMVFLLLGGIPKGHAEEVKMFHQVPSVQELRESLGTSYTGKTRGIVFGAAASAPRKGVEAIGMPIDFAYDSSTILPETIPYLKQIGRLLQSDASINLLIEGHTDASGSEDYNLSLSDRRARSVREYLLSSFHIKPSRLEWVGKGKSVPLNKNDPMAAENRRVQFRRIADSK